MRGNKYIHYTIVILALFLIIVGLLLTKERVVIGFAQCTGGDWRIQMNNQMLSESKFYDNVKIEILNANGDTQKQIEDIRRLIKKQVDLLIVSPVEDSVIVQEFNKINFKGIPIVLADRNLSSNKHISFIGASNIEVGELAAQYITKKRGDIPTEIVLIRGFEQSTPTVERRDGFVNTLKEYQNYNITTIVSGNDRDGISLKNTQKIIQENINLIKDVDVVYAFNDAMAIIVSEELKKIGVKERPIIIGVDGLMSYGGGIEAVRRGDIDVTIVYPTGGEKIISTIMQIIQKYSIAKEINLPVTLIDKDNVDAYYKRSIELIEQQNKSDILYNKYERLHRRALVLFSMIIAIFITLGYWFIYRYYKLTKHKEVTEYDKTIGGIVDFKKNMDSLIKAHYAEEDLDMNKFVEQLDVPRAYFYSKFKDIYHDTPNNYLRNYRLDKSKELIKTKTYNISEIAYMVGFSSPAYYTKCFKERFKCTPTEFLQTLNN
ncbi:MAG: substrate-binding domain-containing protein [Rikenellaceae bacterium]